ncbi:MAG TPA: DUF2442 domain-containing protein [Chlamydiales bacterium]|nr:DUF2442 domain-containing protein [Chlamydiales bacterium]
METNKFKIVACKPLPNYHIWIRFDDGLEGEVDLNHLVGKGVFEVWNSIDFFNNVRVDSKSDTVAWGEDIDLDAYVLREKIETKKKADHESDEHASW